MSLFEKYLFDVPLDAPLTPQISNGNGVAVTLLRVSFAVPQDILAYRRRGTCYPHTTKAHEDETLIIYTHTLRAAFTVLLKFQMTRLRAGITANCGACAC